MFSCLHKEKFKILIYQVYITCLLDLKLEMGFHFSALFSIFFLPIVSWEISGLWGHVLF